MPIVRTNGVHVHDRSGFCFGLSPSAQRVFRRAENVARGKQNEVFKHAVLEEKLHGRCVRVEQRKTHRGVCLPHTHFLYMDNSAHGQMTRSKHSVDVHTRPDQIILRLLRPRSGFGISDRLR